MSDNKPKHSEPAQRNWASIFDDFLNLPPTGSLFRLYLLCFLIWNKKVIIYLFSGDDLIRNRLNNLYEFVPNLFFLGGLWSMYFGPVLLLILIISITFIKCVPVLPINWRASFSFICKKQTIRHYL